MRHELFEFLTTPAGQDIIYESGYVPLNQESGISDICEDDGAIISIMYTDFNGIPHAKPHNGIMLRIDIYNSGKRKSSKIIAR